MFKKYLSLPENVEAVNGRQIIMFTGDIKQHQHIPLLRNLRQNPNPVIILTLFAVISILLFTSLSYIHCRLEESATTCKNSTS